MLHDTASVKLENIRDRYRRTALRILSQVDQASVVINSRVEHREVRDRYKPRESVDGLV